MWFSQNDVTIQSKDDVTAGGSVLNTAFIYQPNRVMQRYSNTT